MGTMWRSQPMEFCEMFLQPNVAYDILAALGKLDVLQFIDLNEDVNAFQRRFTHEIRQLEEFERQIRFFQSELTLAEITASNAAVGAEVPPSREMQSMRDNFSRFENQLKEMEANNVKLRKQHSDLLELQLVLDSAPAFFSEADAARTTVEGNRDDSQLKFITGVIPADKLLGFERLLWRACRGNVYLLQSPLPVEFEDPVSKSKTSKVAFIIFYQGIQLETKVRKICDGYDANIYNCSSNSGERSQTLIGVKARLADMNMVLARSAQLRQSVLVEIGLHVSTWSEAVIKMKSIFHVLNMFATNNPQCLVARCWCPTAELKRVQQLLTSLASFDASAIIHSIPSGSTRPTYFKTNKFTAGFLSIVEAYGVANYMEVNPAPFTIITFPFLFAVMFGDLGHGFIMAMAALAMILKEEKLLKFKDGGEIWNTIFGGRYIVFLMGLFSMYTGFIYNDMFSKALSLTPSNWILPPYSNVSTDDTITLDVVKQFDGAYYQGIDPMWQLSENALTYTNSYKMKMAVILGVLQMLFGIILSLYNHLYFRRYMNVYFEFIPQVLFLMCIFGYLGWAIFFKWTQNYNCENCSAPSLLIMLINMFLSFGSNPSSDQVLFGSADGSTQGTIQSALVVIAVLCVPIMLFTKPCLLNKVNKRAKTIPTVHLSRHNEDNDAIINDEFIDESSPLLHKERPSAPLCGGLFGAQGLPGGDAHDDDHGEFSFGEVMVHQAIHTIEFCLGCISNTASYLRLWALSLAHGQLSEVLWQMVLHNGFGSFYMLFAAFAVWAVMTIMVLLIMEGLSAFLHALRLHWVEFQNKFYGGNGQKFKPFSFQRILDGVDD